MSFSFWINKSTSGGTYVINKVDTEVLDSDVDDFKEEILKQIKDKSTAHNKERMQ